MHSKFFHAEYPIRLSEDARLDGIIYSKQL